MSDRWDCARDCTMPICEDGRNCCVHGREQPFEWVAFQFLMMLGCLAIIGAFIWKAVT